MPRQNNWELFKMIFEPGFERKSDLCQYCFQEKPQEDPDDEDATYCSKKCALTHALEKLTGEIVDECEKTVEGKKESTGPLTPKEIPVAKSEGGGSGEKSASSRLCLRLIELGDDEDDLTIENLLATIEGDDEDSFEDSEPSSSRPFSSARPDSPAHDYDRPTLDLFKYAIRRSLVLSGGQHSSNRSVRESLDYAPSLRSPPEEQREAVDNPTSNTDHAQGVVPTKSEDDAIEGVDRSPTFGLASRLREALNKFGSIPKRNSNTKKIWESPNNAGVLETSMRRSRLVTPTPSGDGWNDFVGILNFMEKTGLGGSTEKPSW